MFFISTITVLYDIPSPHVCTNCQECEYPAGSESCLLLLGHIKYAKCHRAKRSISWMPRVWPLTVWCVRYWAVGTENVRGCPEGYCVDIMEIFGEKFPLTTRWRSYSLNGVAECEFKWTSIRRPYNKCAIALLISDRGPRISRLDLFTRIITLSAPRDHRANVW